MIKFSKLTQYGEMRRRSYRRVAVGRANLTLKIGVVVYGGVVDAQVMLSRRSVADHFIAIVSGYRPVKACEERRK